MELEGGIAPLPCQAGAEGDSVSRSTWDIRVGRDRASHVAMRPIAICEQIGRGSGEVVVAGGDPRQRQADDRELRLHRPEDGRREARAEWVICWIEATMTPNALLEERTPRPFGEGPGRSRSGYRGRA